MPGTRAEVNLHELLRLAQFEFKSVKTIDEDELKSDWPRLRAALGRAFLDWNGEFRIEVDRSQKSVTVAKNGLLPPNVKKVFLGDNYSYEGNLQVKRRSAYTRTLFKHSHIGKTVLHGTENIRISLTP